MSSLLRRVQIQRLALGLCCAAATATARGRLPLPPPRLAALRSRFSSAHDPTAAAPRSRFATRLSGMLGLFTMCGGIVDAPGRETDPDAIELARFAVAEHNSNTNAALEFVRLVKVRQQVVEGRMFYFSVEVREIESGLNKLYEAKVWLRPWLKFKRLEAFEPVVDVDEGKTEVWQDLNPF